MTSTLLTEIAEQPAALARLLAERRDAVAAVAARVRGFAPTWVSIAARGSSDNAARYAQYLLGAHNRLGVALAVPSLYTVYGAPPRVERALTIAISQSGQGPDVRAVVEEARRQGGLTLAITNDPGSPLARAAELSLVLATRVEHAVAATKTYTNQLLLLAMLSVALDPDPARAAELARVPDQVADALATAGDLAPLAAGLAAAERIVVLGRGLTYGTAFELALKLKETSYVLAEPWSFADFQHGPIAMVDAGFPVVLIAPSGAATDDVPPLLAQLRARRAHLVAVSDRADVLAQADAGIRLPAGVPEWLAPIVAIVPGQRWAHALALARGHDPDHPRDLAKVTRTR